MLLNTSNLQSVRSRQWCICVLDGIPNFNNFTPGEHLQQVHTKLSLPQRMIKQNQYKPATTESTTPNLSMPFYHNLFLDQIPLHAQWVLVNVYDLLVAQNLQSRIGDAAQVTADQQWGLQHRPQCEVGLVLVMGHASVADLEHVGVVPGTRSSVLG